MIRSKPKNAEHPRQIMALIMKKRLRWLTFILIGVLTWLLIGYGSAYYATSAAHQAIKVPSALEQFPIQNISIQTSDQLTIRAWLVGKSDKTVMLLTGVRGNRMANTTLALLYLKAGYAVLLPDLRGTGESDGNIISFGWHEQKDVLACYRYLQQLGKTHIGIHGCSLGAAAITYALPNLTNCAFIVLESPYNALENAISHRMEKFLLPQWVYSPMLWFGAYLADIDIEKLQPQLAIKQLKQPLLYLAGTHEKVLPKEETMHIFNQAPSVNKRLHFFKGADHQDFLHTHQVTYIQVLYQFLKTI